MFAPAVRCLPERQPDGFSGKGIKPFDSLGG
jgi:hypothetical protein